MYFDVVLEYSVCNNGKGKMWSKAPRYQYIRKEVTKGQLQDNVNVFHFIS